MWSKILKNNNQSQICIVIFCFRILLLKYKKNLIYLSTDPLTIILIIYENLIF